MVRNKIDYENPKKGQRHIINVNGLQIKDVVVQNNNGQIAIDRSVLFPKPANYVVVRGNIKLEED
jgi:hypothetical protein